MVRKTGAAARDSPPPARAKGSACPHRPPCPGCPRFGEQGIAAPARHRLAALAQRHGIPDVPVISGATAGFRLRARLAIRGRVGSPKLGLFEAGSHRVVHIPHCSVHHPLINRVASVVRRALVEEHVSCYSDKAHQGVARYLQVVIERSSQTAQVVLVANAPAPDALAGCLELIRARLGADLHSLWFNAHQEASNTVLGPVFQRWCGPPSLVEHFSGPAVHYPPGAFGQNNLEIAQRIVDLVREEIPLGSRVAEFYAGVGAIGLSIVERTSELTINEASPHALEGLDLGLAALEPAVRARISVRAGAAAAACAAALAADVVIADPPRKGLDPELRRQLCDQPPPRLIYVSCGLDSFEGDAERLTASGALRLRRLTAFNLMPFTEHVETVAVFETA